MLKFKYTSDNGRVLIGFGLSEENLRLLKQGKPIYVDLTEMGLNADFTIMYGKTEADIAEELKPFMGKDTKIHGA